MGRRGQCVGQRVGHRVVHLIQVEPHGVFGFDRRSTSDRRGDAAVFGVPFGRLPGDIVVRRGNFSFYFPIATSIVISILLSLLFFLLRR